MKNPLKYALLLLAAIIIGASIYGVRYYHYNYVEQVSDYYIIYIDMPRVVKGAFRDRTQEGKVEIKNLGRYPNDSTAIAKETKRSEEFDEHCLNKLQECPRGSIEWQVYSELLEQSRILMRFSHIRKFDKRQIKEAKKKIIKNGVFSEEVRRYMDKNKIDAEFYTIK
ncbi:MAG: hypothetical protein J5733_05795 [Bacteroidaceae bacterium]|nr:hypothetical protein [Bacteroidaceae bacterium]